MKFLNCKGKLLDFEKPRIMGILNVTPDSFYDGGKYLNEKQWLLQTEMMLAEGADIIDVGCTSSRPGALISDVVEEKKMLGKVVGSLVRTFDGVVVSADTYHADAAIAAVDEGACIINDISGGNIDKMMFRVVSELGVPYVLSHIIGIPETMKSAPSYTNVTRDVMLYLSEKIALLQKMGVCDVIIDPGFGFGKGIHDNFELLRNLEMFRVIEKPLMVGISRKSMIWKTLNITPEQAMTGTTVLNTLAVIRGANILRVHDVKEAKQAVELALISS